MAAPAAEINDFAPDMTGLSESEKSHLMGVLRKAKEMEDEASLNQPLEGSLSKYTNVMKGWQFRWFVLDPVAGQLDYYVSEDARKGNRPRGSVTLVGAVVSPTDEDSQTFNVNATNGEVFRLRAVDAKERQHWVSRLRAVVQKLNESLSKNLRQSTSPAEQITGELQPSSQVHHVTESPNSTLTYLTQFRTKRSYSSPATRESIHNAEQIIDQAETQKHQLVADIERLPHSGAPVTALDEECLLLKATSQSTVSCLEDCLNMLQEQDHTHYPHSDSELEISKSMASISVDIKSNLAEISSHNSQSSTSLNKMPHIMSGEVNHDEDVCDPAIDEEKELGGVEQHKSVILHLLSQLKLGMDLTRVVLPTFILEKRSLLEMFADFFGHPDMFLRIADQVTPEARMLAVVEYYLCSFHVGRKGSLAKKPYNPIIGETFHCSWQVPSSSSSSSSSQQAGQSSKGSSKCRLIYLAEQVSHHPPVTGFYTECAEKRISMNACIWTKSKFMGMSVGVVMVGDGNIHLLDHNENYTLTFPSAFGRSILTVPWMELGGKVNIHCQQTGYHASVTFLTKPFYGGKVHRVAAEVKNNLGVVICKASGEWNGLLELTYATGEKKQVDTTRLSPVPKSVRPLELQEPYESRKLWQHVTNSLKVGDLNTATEHKKQLEERQRHEEKHRKQTKTQWETQFFSKNGDSWLYKKPLT